MQGAVSKESRAGRRGNELTVVAGCCEMGEGVQLAPLGSEEGAGANRRNSGGPILAPAGGLAGGHAHARRMRAYLCCLSSSRLGAALASPRPPSVVLAGTSPSPMTGDPAPSGDSSLFTGVRRRISSRDARQAPGFPLCRCQVGRVLT